VCCLSENPLIQEIVAMHAGSIDFSSDGDLCAFSIILPPASSTETTTVLVIDDNEELVAFYEAFAAGTCYTIVHVSSGQNAFEAIEQHRPRIIVLDVMLPDVDGWELLVQLHGHPDTRLLPIIVCSVVRNSELALSLGAALYVPKPVGRQQFIQALDQALSLAASEASREAENNVPACQWASPHP
jgi:CheY-like chemotaxis protein